MATALAETTAAWMRDAACKGRARDLDPPDGFPDEPARRDAQRICWDCPVLDDCRAWVSTLPIRLQPTGITAALTEQQRRARRGAATRAARRRHALNGAT